MISDIPQLGKQLCPGDKQKDHTIMDPRLIINIGLTLYHNKPRFPRVKPPGCLEVFTANPFALLKVDTVAQG